MIFNLMLNGTQEAEKIFDSPMQYVNDTTSIIKWMPLSVSTSYYIFTKCLEIGSKAFINNSTITRIDCDECVTIGSSAFYSCSNLLQVSFPKATTVGTYAFGNCTKLRELRLPQCSDMSLNVMYNTAIEVFDYGHIDATTLSGITAGISSTLQTVYLSKCEFLTYRAFRSCSLLKYIDLPNCSIIGVQAFSGCSTLSSLSLPKVEMISKSAFQNTSNLTDIYLLSNSVVNLLAQPSSTFYYSNSSYITTIHVPASLVSAYKSATNWALMSDRIVPIEEQE